MQFFQSYAISGTGAGTTLAVVVPGVIAGDLICIGVGGIGSFTAANNLSVADSGSNTYSQLGYQHVAGANVMSSAFWCLVGTGGSLTITLTSTVSGLLAMSAEEYTVTAGHSITVNASGSVQYGGNQNLIVPLQIGGAGSILIWSTTAVQSLTNGQVIAPGWGYLPQVAMTGRGSLPATANAPALLDADVAGTPALAGLAWAYSTTTAYAYNASVNLAMCAIAFQDAVNATTYSVQGPSSGAISAPSVPFWVTPNTNVTGTFTPHTSGTGTFAPATLTWAGTAQPQAIVYTPTSTAGISVNITFTNTAGLTDPSAVNFLVLAAVVPPTNLNLYYSPYNSYSNGSGTLQANNVFPASTFVRHNNPGSYLKFSMLSGGAGICRLVLDNSPLSGLLASNCPLIAVSVDGGVLTTTQLVYSVGQTSILLASGLSAGVHTFMVWFKSRALAANGGNDSWTNLTTSASVVKHLGVSLDTGSSLTTQTLYTNNVIVFSDSVGETVDVNENIPGGLYQEIAFASDATQGWPFMLAQLVLNAEIGLIGWASQGYNQVGNLNVPILPNAYNLYSNGFSRLLGGGGTTLLPVPTYIIDSHGGNGVVTAAEVLAMLGNYRTIAGSTGTQILKLVPWQLAAEAAIISAVNSYQAANPTDNLKIIDIGVNLKTDFTTAPDFAHMNTRGIAQYATGCARLIGLALAPAAPITTNWNGGLS